MPAITIARTPIVDDDHSGTTGTSLDNAWKQELYGQIDGALGQQFTKDSAQDAKLALINTGAWTDVPFNAANFSALAPMTWTVGASAVVRNRYTISGKTLIWSFYISWFSGVSVLGGSPALSLRLAMPPGCVAQGPQMLPVAFAAGVGAVPLNGLYAATNGALLELNRLDGINFALSMTPGFIATFLLEIQ
jgi:hypothetical protein